MYTSATAQNGGGQMKKYIGIYKTERNGYLKNMVQTDYNSKNDFSADLRRNGYRVIAILTDEEINKIKNSDHEMFHKYLNLDFEYVTQCL